MSRILFAWELGAGYGHLGPFRPIAERLLSRGHELTVAARDVQNAAAVFGSLPAKIVQAPICVKTYTGLEEPPLNFSEILMRCGYLDARFLAALLHAWRGLLDLTRADVLVADYAPTALLAARGRQVARVAVGTAFGCPSQVSPTPNMRSWIDVPRQRLAGSDALVLETVNASLAGHAPPLAAVHEIFDGVICLLTGVPELDPYGARDRESYLGLYDCSFGSVPPRWPDGDGPRIFAYLSEEYRHLDLVLDALAGAAARCSGYIRETNPVSRDKYRGSRLLLSDKPVDLDAGIAASDFCVCHGGVGTVMNILRRGKPMLLLPVQLETFLLAAKLKAMGIAEVVHPEKPPVDIAGGLARMLGNPSLAGSARAFAAEHGGSSVDTIVQRAAIRIEAMAQTQGASL